MPERTYKEVIKDKARRLVRSKNRSSSVSTLLPTTAPHSYNINNTKCFPQNTILVVRLNASTDRNSANFLPVLGSSIRRPQGRARVTPSPNSHGCLIVLHITYVHASPETTDQSSRYQHRLTAYFNASVMINEILTRLLFLVRGVNEFSGPPWNASSPCPTAMAVRPHRNSFCLRNPEAQYCKFPNMTLAHSALTQCPAVDTLDVWLEYPDCLGGDWDRLDFPFVEGETYPPLRSLKLDGYAFGGLDAVPKGEAVEMGYCMGPVGKHHPWDEESPWFQVSDWVKSNNDKLEKQWEEQGGRPRTNLDMWLDAMDWSQLEELSINTKRTSMLDAIQKLPQHLTSLKTLHIDSLPFITNLRNHTLETLHWIGPTHPSHLPTILAHQGASLKRLEYRCDELACPLWPSHTNTTLLPLLAPSLEHLSINLPRHPNGTWPLAHLTQISRLPSLKTLDLYFRLQSPPAALKRFLGASHANCAASYRALPYLYGPTACESPSLDTASAMSMFEFLRAQHSPVQSATFRVGDWSPPFPQAWNDAPFGRTMVQCRSAALQPGGETCVPVNEDYCLNRYGGEPWEWDEGEATWVQDGDFEALEEAVDREDFVEEERVRSRMRERLGVLLEVQSAGAGGGAFQPET